MGTLDIILLVCFIPALVQGIRKGFLQQITGIVSIFLGAFIAFKFSSTVSAWLLPLFENINPKLLEVISFAIIVVIVVLVLLLLCNLLVKLLRDITLEWINRLLGLLFSVFKAALILGLVITVFEGINNVFTIVDKTVLDDSVMYTAIKAFSNAVFPFIKDLLHA